MKDNILIAKLSSLLENEDPIVNELILHTVGEVESKQLSTEAHAKQVERVLDFSIQQIGVDK